MADAEQIATLRVMINEPDSTVYTDEAIGSVIDQADGKLDLAAAELWQQKAGRFSSLVNTSESGSSRNLGDLYKNALAMAKYYTDKAKPAPEPEPAARASRTRPMRRA